jgi:hypothetical protein
MNGLRVPNPSPGDLVEGAEGKHLDRNEIGQGLALMNIPESSPFSPGLFATQT